MRRLLLLALLAGCGDLTGGSGGVVALEIRSPAPAYLEPGDTLQLRARALNLAGDSVAAVIFWRLLDTTAVLLDSTTGRITGLVTSGTARVQARTGSIFSDLLTLTLRGPSDTLVITGSDTLRVLSGDTASGPLLAAVQSDSPPGQGVNNATIVYEVVDSPSVVGLVRFQGGGLRLRALTGASGEPLVGVTLRRVPGAAQPDSVQVSIQASRPSGGAVDGSGQVFTVRFDP